MLAPSASSAPVLATTASVVVLIPALNPGPELAATLAALRAARPGLPVLVVDDGSGPAYAATFARAAELDADVLTLSRNRGKGCALKAGLARVRHTHPGAGVVTADADGQHAPADILAVADRLAAAEGDALVLGERSFDGAVPARSRVGNAVTARLFALATRRRIRDTQTGLRGLTPGLLAWAEGVSGERYEYELRMLLDAARDGVPVASVPISTIYVDDNAASHFRPVRDSLRVYAPFLGFLASSLAAFALDTVALLALFALTGHLLLSVVGARVLSGSVNFAVNRRLVFDRRRRTPLRRAAMRYAALAAALVGVNYLLLAGLTGLGLPLLGAKLLTELTLVTASYLAQRVLVFRPHPGPGRRTAKRTDGSQADITGPTGRRNTVVADHEAPHRSTWRSR